MSTGPYIVRIPAWVRKDGTEVSATLRKAMLVARLNKGRVPHPDLVRRFYGSNAPRGAFGAKSVDRLVFEYAKDAYVIVPDTASNRGNWWPLT